MPWKHRGRKICRAGVRAMAWTGVLSIMLSFALLLTEAPSFGYCPSPTPRGIVRCHRLLPCLFIEHRNKAWPIRILPWDFLIQHRAGEAAFWPQVWESTCPRERVGTVTAGASRLHTHRQTGASTQGGRTARNAPHTVN